MRATHYFRSRKDVLFSLFLLGFSALGIVLSYWILTEGPLSYLNIFAVGLTLLTCALLLWVYLNTGYRLAGTGLSYRSGPLSGTIELGRIREIVKGRTLWVGLRPATARKGLIVKYDKFDEIYISPESNEAFIETILAFKGDIRIVDAAGTTDHPPHKA